MKSDSAGKVEKSMKIWARLVQSLKIGISIQTRLAMCRRIDIDHSSK
jgi:hypothetical protein